VASRRRRANWADRGFSKELWFRHFKKPFSDIPAHPSQILSKIESYYFASAWSEVYDFLEAVVDIQRDARLDGAINEVLERELSGYRLVLK
jgi:hypothetical protein